ncbi:MAG: hypothetical protein ACLRT5_05040 [Lachnospiraceae bacterium]
MKNLKIALLQIAPGGSLEENLEKGLASCRKAREMGADIALFPEMWSELVTAFTTGRSVSGRRRLSTRTVILSEGSGSWQESFPWPSG